MAKHNNPNRKDIKITNVNSKVVSDLKEIADSMGVSMSSFIKPKLTDIIDQYNSQPKKN